MHLQDDGTGRIAESIRYYRDHRHELHRIRSASVAFPGYGSDARYPLILRDSQGNQLALSGCAAGYPGEGPRAAMEILVDAGFAAEVAALVFTHRQLSLLRYPNGATQVLHAVPARPQPPGRGRADLEPQRPASRPPGRIAATRARER